MTDEQNEQPQSNLPEKLGAPARRALLGAGYHRLEQFATVRESEIKKLHGIGPNALAKLHTALKEIGLSFADEN